MTAAKKIMMSVERELAGDTAYARLTALNVRVCDATGAGRGAETGAYASMRWEEYMRELEIYLTDLCREALSEVSGRGPVSYVEGFVSRLGLRV